MAAIAAMTALETSSSNHKANSQRIDFMDALYHIGSGDTEDQSAVARQQET